MAKQLHIVRYSEQQQEFLADLDQFDASKAPTAQQFQLESKYRQAVAGKDNFKDTSFLIKDDQKIQALILCHKQNDTLIYNSRGVDIIYEEENKKILSHALEQLKEIAAQHSITKFKICDYTPGAQLSLLGELAYNNHGIATVKSEVLVDLTQDEDDIHRNIRKSYKSLINQGKREIDFKLVNSQAAAHDEFEKFREFHKKTAGKVTRSIESWEAQFEMVKNGCAELLCGYMEPHGLVSTALCIDHGETTYYGVAVYNRDLFDKPLGHASVYQSILNAKERQQKYFSLGIIFQKDTVTDKEYNIGIFKKGFCDRLTCFLEWEIPVNETT